jgi:acyl carrier protein
LLWYSATALAKIQRSMAETLGVAPEHITAKTPLTGTLGADSLDTVELVMQLEEEFDVQIPDTAAEQIQSVGDLIRYLERKHRDEQG